jgi:hypothetical protein
VKRLWARLAAWWGKPENSPLERVVVGGNVTVTGRLAVKKTVPRQRSLRQEREARRRRPLGK